MQAIGTQLAVLDENAVSRVHGRRRHRSSGYEPVNFSINSIAEITGGINAVARIRSPYRKVESAKCFLHRNLLGHDN
jgi:hypothetical protein